MAQFQAPPTWALPVIVDEQTGRTQFNPIWLDWFVQLVGIVNQAGGTSVGDHNLLTGIQGGLAGTPGERYHLNQTDNTSLLALLSVSRLNATITTAKLTPAGANGSMTFSDGLLTAQTPAT